MATGPLESGTIPTVSAVLFSPCHEETLVVIQLFSEQHGDDQLRAHEEPYLLLHASKVEHTSAHVLVGEIDLQHAVTAPLNGASGIHVQLGQWACAGHPVGWGNPILLGACSNLLEVGGGGEDPALERECAPRGAGCHPFEVVEQACQLAGLAGLDHTPTAVGEEPVEVYERKRRVLRPPLYRVPGGERAEEGVGQETGGLLLRHGDLVGFLLSEEGEGVGHRGGETEGEVDDAGEEGGEEVFGLLVPAVRGEVVVEVVESPTRGVARIIDENGVSELVGIGDGLCGERVAYQLPSWNDRFSPALPADGILAHLGAGHLHVTLVPDVLEVVWERDRGFAWSEQHAVCGGGKGCWGQDRVR